MWHTSAQSPKTNDSFPPTEPITTGIATGKFGAWAGIAGVGEGPLRCRATFAETRLGGGLCPKQPIANLSAGGASAFLAAPRLLSFAHAGR